MWLNAVAVFSQAGSGPPLPAASPPAEPGGEGIRSASSPAERRERRPGRRLHPRSGGRADLGCSEDSWMNRSSAACVRAAGRVGVVGSLPLSRCATAPPRGEHSDRAVREGTAGWRTSARGLAVAASIGRAPLCHSVTSPARSAGGEGSRAADLRIRSATPCGRPGREGSRSADPPIRSATPCGRPGREGSRSADPRIRSATPCGRPGRERSRSADPRIRSATPCGRPGREGSRSADPPDSVGHSLWPTGARGEPVGRSPDSVGHSLWPTGGHVSLPTGEAISTWRRLFLRSGR